MIATRRENFIPSKSCALCSDHFKENDFEYKVKGNSKLKKDAVPSIFNFPSPITKNQS
jgi:hypothetical protein